ncbi:hypothetical protein Drorol1_Dr00011528, partial [Drosera rotundifolia]
MELVAVTGEGSFNGWLGKDGVDAGLTLSEIIVTRVVTVAEHNSTRLGGSNLEWIKTLCACLFPCVGAEHWCRNPTPKSSLINGLVEQLVVPFLLTVAQVAGDDFAGGGDGWQQIRGDEAEENPRRRRPKMKTNQATATKRQNL